MVDFRYHLVSIIAIFLALALGLVLGTTQLNGLVLDNLRGSVTKLTGDKRGLEADVRDLQGQVSGGGAFVRTVGPELVRGSLAGHSVVLVSAPDAPARQREDLLPLLQDAGATVTGSLRLTSGLLDPTRKAQVEDVVTANVPAGLALPQAGPVERAATELAVGLVRRGGQSTTSSAGDRVLTAFADADLLDVDGQLNGRADLVVILGGALPVDPPGQVPDEATLAQRSAQVSGVLAVAGALDAASAGAVVAAPASTADSGGLLAALRADRDLAARVSSVDAADEAQGPVAVTLALKEQLTGEAGGYGRARGAEGPLPTPQPS